MSSAQSKQFSFSDNELTDTSIASHNPDFDIFNDDELNVHEVEFEQSSSVSIDNESPDEVDVFEGTSIADAPKSNPGNATRGFTSDVSHNSEQRPEPEFMNRSQQKKSGDSIRIGGLIGISIVVLSLVFCGLYVYQTYISPNKNQNQFAPASNALPAINLVKDDSFSQPVNSMSASDKPSITNVDESFGRLNPNQSEMIAPELYVENQPNSNILTNTYDEATEASSMNQNDEMLMSLLADMDGRIGVIEASTKGLQYDSAVARQAATEAVTLVISMKEQLAEVKKTLAETNVALANSGKKIEQLSLKVDGVKSSLNTSAKGEGPQSVTKAVAQQQKTAPVSKPSPTVKQAPAPKPKAAIQEASNQGVSGLLRLNTYEPLLLTKTSVYVLNKSNNQKFILARGKKYPNLGRVAEIDMVAQEVRGYTDDGQHWVISKSGSK